MSMTANRWSLGLLVLVALVAMSSKGIILYNEEILVALAFIGFVTFCVQNYGDSVAESLDARSDAIKQELQTYLDLKETYLKALAQEHQKQIGLAQGIQGLGQFAYQQLETMGSQRQKELSRRVHLQVNQQLNSLASMGSGLQHQLQSHMAKGLRAAVLESMQRAKKAKKPIKPQLVQKAIEQLSSLS